MSANTINNDGLQRPVDGKLSSKNPADRRFENRWRDFCAAKIRRHTDGHAVNQAPEHGQPRANIPGTMPTMPLSVDTLGAAHPSQEIFRRGEHALVGLSPFNGYYSRESVMEVLGWISQRFTEVDVLVPGWEAAHTLTRTGVPARRAVRKARKDTRALANMAVTALTELGKTDASTRVHNWTRLLERPAYRELRKKVRAQYEGNPHVRVMLDEIVTEAVRVAAGHEPDQLQLDTGVGYLLAELPFMIDSASIFEVPSSAFVYHRRFDLAERLLTGNLAPLHPAPNQAVVIVSSEGAVS